MTTGLAAAAAAEADSTPTVLDLSQSFSYAPSFDDSPGSSSLVKTTLSQPKLIRAITVLEKGQIVFEYARDDVDPTQTFPVYSVTKSFVSLIIGMLIDDGILSLDETLGDVFLNKRCIDGVLWNKVDQADFVQEVTIEEMLTMTSGLLNPNIDPDEVDWTDPYVQANHGDANLTHTLNYLDASGEKGEFHYVLTSQILGYVIKERSGLTPRQFAKERIFPLLGISDDEIKWKENHDGLQQSFSGLHLNQEQMSKFGQLYLQRGLAGGDDASRVVSDRWVEESTTPKIGAGFPGLSMGYLFWPCKSTFLLYLRLRDA